MTTIVLADDHSIVRQGLLALLQVESDFEVIGEASDGLETCQLVERIQPDVLVTDLMMGSISGLEVARQVKKRSPRTSVIILSMYGDESYVLEALRAGAKAYVLKESSSDELVRAVREVSTGHRYLSRTLSERAINGYIRKNEDTIMDPYDALTAREREILHLIADGFTTSEIAKQLYLSPRTVETHRNNLMRKLGLHSRADILRFAVQKGIIPVDTSSLSKEDRE